MECPQDNYLVTPFWMLADLSIINASMNFISYDTREGKKEAWEVGALRYYI